MIWPKGEDTRAVEALSRTETRKGIKGNYIILQNDEVNYAQCSLHSLRKITIQGRAMGVF